MDFRTWVSDTVMSLLGLSEPTVIDFMIATAQSAKSPASLLETLQSVTDLPQTPAVASFVSQLYSKVPRKSSFSTDKEAARERKSAKKEQVSLLQKNQSYSLILDEPVSDEPILSIDKKATKAAKKLRKKQESERLQDWEKEDEPEPVSHQESVAIEEELDETERIERERERDLQERDEFASRLKERDKEKTKKVRDFFLVCNPHAQFANPRLAKAEEEANARRAIASDRQARESVLPDLRMRSRQEYLRKREEQRLELLARKVEDEEMLFRGDELTKKERKELELNKQLLKLTKERLQLSDKVDGYVMPEDYITEKGNIDRKKQNDLLYGRYQDSKKETEHFVSEQEQLEQEQVRLETLTLVDCAFHGQSGFQG